MDEQTINADIQDIVDGSILTNVSETKEAESNNQNEDQQTDAGCWAILSFFKILTLVLL